MSNCRSAIAVLLTVFIMTGCTTGAEIPRRYIDDPKYREPGNYRIRVKGWNEYFVKRFSVTDSTVVIEELSPVDERFRMGREGLPYTISWDQVESISRVKTSTVGTAAIVVVVGLFVSFIVGLSTADLVIGT